MPGIRYRLPVASDEARPATSSGGSRFRVIPAAELNDAQRRLAEELTKSPRGEVRGPYIPLIYSPELADRMRHLGDFIRFGGVLDGRTKELLVLACARRYSVHYMFAVHREFSAAAGLSSEVVDTIAEGRRPTELAGGEAAAYDLAIELLESAEVSDETFEAARAHYGESGVVELVTFVGYYTALAMLLNCARLPVPEGGVELPELRP